MAKPCYDPIARYGLEGVDLNAPISFREIVEVAGAQDAIWCFAVGLPGHEALKRHFAVDCAERGRHLMEDPRSLAALEVARRHALGQATDEELAAAWDAAWDAVWAARDAAGAAAGAAWAAWAARDAAGAAAWAAAGAAARAAAGAAARAAAGAAAEAGTAGAAARAAEINWQVRRLIEITDVGSWSMGSRI